MRLITFIIVLFLATMLGVLIRHDPGYALFAYQGWTIEMPLWLTLLLIIGIILLGIFILWSLYLVFSSSSRLKLWWSQRQAIRSRRLFTRGLLELAEGSYKKAEIDLRDSARFSDSPLIHYLSAARAAEKNNAPDRRDKYLQLAHDVSGGSDVAVRLTEAQFHFEHGDFEQSIAILQHLHLDHPKHPQVLKLLCTVYQIQQDWHSLLSLLPELKKSNIFASEQALCHLECSIYQGLLPEFAQQPRKSLEKFWRKAPKAIQTDPTCIMLYAEGLIAQGADSTAEEVVRATLTEQWDPKLIEFYGKIKSPASNKQLNFAENCLEEHRHDPYLYLTLGRLCVAQSLWGKARDYLEMSITLQPLPESYALLGQVMEQMGQTEKAQQYYKTGLLKFNREEYGFE